jgi:hypothetical protein
MGHDWLYAIRQERLGNLRSNEAVDIILDELLQELLRCHLIQALAGFGLRQTEGGRKGK